MTVKIITQAPTRVDLVGGTLDLWPIAQILPAKSTTVNIAIGMSAKIEITLSNSVRYTIESIDQKVKLTGDYDEIVVDKKLILFSLIIKTIWKKEYPPLNVTALAQSPAGAGLGGSSCLAVTFITALFQMQKELGILSEVPTENILVRTAQDIEAQIIHAPTGVQDYWGAVRGGLNIITFPAGGEHVETLASSFFEPLTHQAIVCYSGQSRSSAINNWEIFKRVFDRDEKLIATLTEMAKTSFKCAESIRKGDFSEALNYSKEEWLQRVRLWPGIQTDKTLELDLAGKASGSFFSRVCGAGGGGVMIFFAPVDKIACIKNALTKSGGTILECGFGVAGLCSNVAGAK